MNVAAPNKDMRTDFQHSLARHFPRLHSIPIPEDINEVVDGPTSATVDQSTTSTGTCSKLGLNIAVEKVKDRLYR